GQAMTRWWAVAVVVAATAPAHAEPVGALSPELSVTQLPPPRHLRMRPRAAARAPSGSRTPPPSPIPAPPAPLSPTDPGDRYDELAGVRDPMAPVSFSVTVGYQVDGARPSGKPTLDGTPVVEGRDYSALRSWGFGEAFASTHGVIADSLSTYLALRFDAAQPQ